MKIACCLPGREIIFKNKEDDGSQYTYYVEGCKLMRELGYDYSETNMANLLMLSDEDVDRLSAEYPDGSLGLCSVNGFLHGWNDMNGLDEDTKAEFYAHIERIVERTEKLGIPYIVFGSGYSRRMREGHFEEDDASVEDFIRHVNRCCQGKKVVCVIEPLNKKETNWGNSVDFCGKLVKRLDLPKIRLLADSYHMAQENEPMSVLEDNKDILLHCHIAAADRNIPGTSQYEKDFIDTLKKIGYDGVISVECHQPDFLADAEKIVKFLREAIA
ncbi:MAG: sugar phosphate isomerase/epimerase [Clostridia bacterium]|nr:sugar phosphate isomerase/epimerase [Clostridia bacterium]